MADLWYYTSEGRQMEPVSTAEIQRLARAGLLKPTDMVWCEGMPRWVRASAAPEVFPDPVAALEKALTAPASASAPVVGPRPNAGEHGASLEEPILLEPLQGPLKPSGEKPSRDRGARPKKRRDEDEDDRDDRPRRRSRRNRHTGLIVFLGLIFGAGLLLVVLVLGLIFIAIGAR